MAVKGAPPAGRMDRLVRFEKATETADAAGELVPAWDSLGQVWAERLPFPGNPAFSEVYREQQLVAKADVVYRMRYPDFEVTPDESCRLVDLSDGGDVYDILHVAEIGRREGLEVLAFRRAE